MLALLVQTKTGTSNLASTVVAFDNNTIAGNSIVVIDGNSSSTVGDISGVTDTQGNVYTKDLAYANATVGEIEIWHTSGIIGGANTVTVAYTTGVACAAIIREYNGFIYTNSLDKQTGTTGNSSSLSSGNTTALSQSSELLIGAGLIPLANSFSAGGNFVNLVSAGAPLVVAVAAEDLLVTTGGPQAALFTANASVQWVCAIATFYLLPTGTTTSVSSTSSTSSSISTTSSSTSSTSTSVSTTSVSTSSTSSSTSYSVTTFSTSSTSSSISSTSMSSTSSSTSTSSTSSSISSTSFSSTSMSSTSSSTSLSSTSSSFSSTSSSTSSTSASTSSTSFSSTSSSSSTSTTVVPTNLIYTYQDSADVITVRQFTVRSPSTWTCPVGVTSVIVEVWGGAGGGGGGAGAGAGGGGGGGGYTRSVTAVTPGTTYTISVGAGGAGGAASTSGTSGTQSFFNTAGTVQANGGTGGTGGAAGAGGAGATAGTGTLTRTGGNGGSGGAGGVDTAAGGGGGVGGVNTNGGSGTNGAGSANVAGGGSGGVGGIGGAGIGTAGAGFGGNSAGGGGGGSSGSNTGGSGASGTVQLTYTVPGFPTSSSNDIDADTNKNYQNLAVDDSDYFIQYGSEYMIQEYKMDWTNNTDVPTFSWKGRSTYDTRVSPLLIQVYNQNSAAWETLAVVNTQPSDTDFTVKVSQTANVSNYYDSSNIVTFRTYQQVI